LLHSAIPVRMAYNGTDGLPRAIPILLSLSHAHFT